MLRILIVLLAVLLVSEAHSTEAGWALLREGGLAGCVDTARGLPWGPRERTVIPPTVEQLRRYLGSAQMR